MELWGLWPLVVVLLRAPPSSSQYSDGDCGHINRAAWYLTSDTQSDANLVIKYPWHVGLHMRNLHDSRYAKSGKWAQKCSGSLIRAHLVLTAAHCVHHKKSPPLKRIKLKDILITAGKNKKDFYDKEEFQQSSKPKKITVNPLYPASQDSEDVAIIELMNPFVISDYVRPVCIKRFQNSELETIPATAVGWNLYRFQYTNHTELLEVKLPVADCHKALAKAEKKNSYYKPFYTRDRFCAYHGNGIAPGNGDSGAGVVAPEGNKWYIYGIVSQGDQAFTMTVMSDVSYHLKFINVTLRTRDETTPTRSVSCELPSQRVECQYEVTNDTCTQECLMGGGGLVEDGGKVKLHCKPGFTPSDNHMEYACLKGKWFHENPRCTKLCEPLKKGNMKVKCGYEYRKVDCNGYVRPGTLAYYNCDKFYTVADPYPFVGVAECQEDGTWNQTLPECVPDGCGFLNKAASNATPAISFGVDAKTVLEYPWHVGLHSKNNSESKWVQMCAGSLIRPHIVLTAAHCLHDPNTQVRAEPEEILVTAGKYKRDFYDIEEFQQSSKAKKLVVPPLYSGFDTNYHQDIAIILLKSSFVINDYVRPVCIKFTHNFELPKTPGSFVGWGFTEKKLTNLGRTGTPSDVLLKTEMPLMDLVECRQVVHRSSDSYFFPYLTVDKLCGRYINGAGPQLGDSGGGLVAPDGLRWFVEGIMSLKNGASTMAAFTKVHDHLDFIKDAMTTTKVASPNIDESPYHRGW